MYHSHLGRLVLTDVVAVRELTIHLLLLHLSNGRVIRTRVEHVLRTLHNSVIVGVILVCCTIVSIWCLIIVVSLAWLISIVLVLE